MRSTAKWVLPLALLLVAGVACEFGIGDDRTSTPIPPGAAVVVGAPTVIPSATPAAILTVTPTATATPIPLPVGSFSADSLTGAAPLIVQFRDLSDGTVASWDWDFGDGSTSTEQSPIHEYTVAGSYTVLLTVSGPGGTNVATLPDAINVDAGRLAEVVVNPVQITVRAQQTTLLGATGFDRFGNEIVEVEFNWTLLGPAGSIDETGLFTAGTVAKSYVGLVKVTATKGQQSSESSIDVTIEPGPIASLVVKPSEVTLDIGATLPFTFKAFDEFGNAISDVLSSWSVPTEVGAIDANGVLTTGTKAGSFLEAIKVDVVKGTSRSSASADISIVPDPLVKVVVDRSEVVMDTGTTRRFTASGFDEHGNEIPELAFIWRAAGGATTNDGLFTAASQTGAYELQASATSRGSQRSASAAIEVFSWAGGPATVMPKMPVNSTMELSEMVRRSAQASSARRSVLMVVMIMSPLKHSPFFLAHLRLVPGYTSTVMISQISNRLLTIASFLYINMQVQTSATISRRL